MKSHIQLGEMSVAVMRKDIQNVHLSVHPPSGRVTIAAPSHMSLDTIRVFAITKMSWIRKQQQTLQNQQREAPREFLDRESHYVWGKRYLLKILKVDSPPAVELKHRTMILSVRPASSQEKCKEILDAWHRQQLREAALPMIAVWEKRLGVKVKRLFIQKMKTKWGSCNHSAAHIRLNTELVKKPKKLLEYVIVHELAHLLEPNHSERFLAILNQHYPTWREARAELNELPLSAEAWK
jgi:predicted metal-dependent hydrolase